MNAWAVVSASPAAVCGGTAGELGRDRRARAARCARRARSATGARARRCRRCAGAGGRRGAAARGAGMRARPTRRGPRGRAPPSPPAARRRLRRAAAPSARSSSRSPWISTAVGGTPAAGRARPSRAPASTTRPPSTGTALHATIASRRGSSPVVSRSTTQNAALAPRRPARRSAALGGRRPPRPTGSSHAEAQLVADPPLHAGDGAERLLERAARERAERGRIEEVVRLLAGLQLLDLVGEPQAEDQLERLLEQPRVVGLERAGVGRGAQPRQGRARA